MPISHRPLSAHPVFTATSLDQLAGALATHLAAKLVKLPQDGRAIDVQANAAKLSQSELWYCAYGMPLSIRFPEGDFLRLQMQYKGLGATWIRNDKMIAVTERQACISSAAAEVDFAADFEQVVWRIPKGRLEQKLALMVGRPIGYALDFGPSLDLSTPQAATLKLILSCLLQAIQAGTNSSSDLVMAELEQAFIATFLATAEHNGRVLLEADAARLAPWQVRRAESYIEANWDQPITIEGLAAVSGTSVRSLFRTFKECRGCSPLDFVRRLRLEHARRMLENGAGAATVTDIAFACGFGDLGRFAKEFQRAFGERPSAVLARKRVLITA